MEWRTLEVENVCEIIFFFSLYLKTILINKNEAMNYVPYKYKHMRIIEKGLEINVCVLMEDPYIKVDIN